MFLARGTPPQSASGAEPVTGHGFPAEGGEVGGALLVSECFQPSQYVGADPGGGIGRGLNDRGVFAVLGVVLRGLLVEACADLLPPRGGCLRFLYATGELRDARVHELRRAIIDDAARRLCRTFGRVGEATVCPVAFHRVDEELPRLRRGLRDDVQQVLAFASGHADVDGCTADAVAEDRMRRGGGNALHPVSGRRIGEVRGLTDVLGRQVPGVLAPARVVGIAHPEGAVSFDLLHVPLLPVRDPQRGVIAAGLDQIAPPDAQPVATGRSRGVVDEATGDPLVADARVQSRGVLVGGDGDHCTVLPLTGDVVV